jgi:secernin
MCDTIYAGPSVSSEGRAWFAKNSDRNPAEPQTLCLVPRGDAGGHSYLLSRPVWMKGGEMGVNDRGVAIGNEAVFSRPKAKKDGILGMDILRAALSRGDSAALTRDYICEFIETHDQGGNGAYKGSLVYSNSFIVSGPDGAFTLETAGRHWAWKRIDGFAAISNAYSIEEDFGELDSESSATITGSWRRAVEDRLYLAFTKGDKRRGRTTSLLAAASPHIDFAAVLGLLRDHGAGGPGKSGMMAPCVHEAGFPVQSSTTASLIFEATEDPSSGLVWFDGTSHPCLSLFAPVLLLGGEFIPLWMDYDYAEGSPASERHWARGRERARSLGGAARSTHVSFVEERDRLQTELRAAALGAGADLGAARREVAAILGAWGKFLDEASSRGGPIS